MLTSSPALEELLTSLLRPGRALDFLSQDKPCFPAGLRIALMHAEGPECLRMDPELLAWLTPMDQDEVHLDPCPVLDEDLQSKTRASGLLLWGARSLQPLRESSLILLWLQNPSHWPWLSLGLDLADAWRAPRPPIWLITPLIGVTDQVDRVLTPGPALLTDLQNQLRLDHPSPTRLPLQDFLAQPSWAALETLWPSLKAAGRLEWTLARLKRLHLHPQKRLRPPSQMQSFTWEEQPKPCPWKDLPLIISRLQAEIPREQNLRAQNWSFDTRRTRLRIEYARQGLSRLLAPTELAALWMESLERAGLELALDCSRPPRPILDLGPHLPIGVEGLHERLDVCLSAPLRSSLARIQETIQRACPKELELVHMDVIPEMASSLLDLARKAHYRWAFPPEQSLSLEAAVQAFQAGHSLGSLEKSAKQLGQKTMKTEDLQGRILDLRIESDGFFFSMPIHKGESLSPLKALAALTGLDHTQIRKVTRLNLEWAEDSRLEQADRYLPKLSNIYEDAVLLGHQGQISLLDENDEEPLILN